MDVRYHRATIFVNGELKDIAAARRILESDDFIVAVDGGMRHIQSMGLVPSLLIGDMDSVSQADIDYLHSLNIPIKRYPIEKDETDLELALLYIAEMGYRSIRIVGGLGGRLDQTLGNLFLLMLPELEESDLRVDDGVEEVFLIRKQVMVEGKAGDIISLLPFNGSASGVLTEGLHYPLERETLFPDRTRGISNVMLGSYAKISLEKGMLLCIHTRRQEFE